MRRLILALALSLLSTRVFAFGYVFCINPPTGGIACFSTSNLPRGNDNLSVTKQCWSQFPDNSVMTCSDREPNVEFDDNCAVIYSNSQNKAFLSVQHTEGDASAHALADCINSENHGFNCKRQAHVCDGTGVPVPPPISVAQTPSQPVAPASPTQTVTAVPPTIIINWTAPPVSLTLLIIILYAARRAIINYIIHGNLPYKLPVYADSVQVLFKRTQRVNWYGRVVFGLTARLGLTEEQLALVRRYWLGRVIVFDSLRRQRQNELARMHLQLAAQMKPEEAGKSKPLSQLWSLIKYFFLFFFCIFRAIINLLVGFLFIRVTISTLARGKLIESANLALILQADEAIERSVLYLKEYLETAETFRGQEDLFEPK